MVVGFWNTVGVDYETDYEIPFESVLFDALSSQDATAQLGDDEGVLLRVANNSTGPVGDVTIAPTSSWEWGIDGVGGDSYTVHEALTIADIDDDNISTTGCAKSLITKSGDATFHNTTAQSIDLFSSAEADSEQCVVDLFDVEMTQEIPAGISVDSYELDMTITVS